MAHKGMRGKLKGKNDTLQVAAVEAPLGQFRESLELAEEFRLPIDSGEAIPPPHSKKPKTYRKV